MEYSSQQYYVKYSDFNIQSEGDNYRMSFSTFLGGNTGELSSRYYRFSKYFRIMGEAGGGGLKLHMMSLVRIECCTYKVRGIYIYHV